MASTALNRAWLASCSACMAALAGCQWASVGQNADGVRMFQQGQYQGALERFQQSIHTDPGNPDGYYNLAATYHRIGKLYNRDADYQQAESYYHQCLDHSAFNHRDCYRGLAVLLTERGRNAEAFKLLDDWAQRQPTLPDPKIELARLSQESGDREAAKQHLIDALSIDPNNAKALAALGKLREEAGETRQALANYERSLAINRFQPRVAERVASLQSALFAPATSGTRTVNAPTAPLR